MYQEVCFNRGTEAGEGLMWATRSASPPPQSLGTLNKPRRQRQRERHKTKGLMSRTVAVHVRYYSWYIS